MSEPPGPGRVLVLAYATLSLAAGARSGVQISSRFSSAPLAYVLSALAAVVYLLGTLLVGTLDRRPARSEWWRRVTAGMCLAELAGVVAVGATSLARPESFPDDTVWSRFGSGYGYVPLVLPLLALLWLRRSRIPERT